MLAQPVHCNGSDSRMQANRVMDDSHAFVLHAVSHSKPASGMRSQDIMYCIDSSCQQAQPPGMACISCFGILT
jgi:hypothetical protein